MKNLSKNISLKLIALAGLTLFSNAGTPTLNIFAPYDILLLQPLVKLPQWQISVAYENLFRGCGMQADDEELCQDWRKCGNILQLYQDNQDALAAFKGSSFDSDIGQEGLIFPNDDGNILFTPYAKLKVDNVMISARYAWINGATFGLYIPVISAQLKDVCWRILRNDNRFESQLDVDIIAHLEQVGGLHLGNWKRSGLGDITAMFTWDRFYPQNKRWLRNVHGGLRGGLIFPTGTRKNDDILFGFAFVNDGSLGILGGATLELWWGRFVRFCIDGQFTQVFSSCKARRIKTDPAQTDLFFLTKVQSDKQIGFTQHYTIYLEAARFYRGLSAKIAYQYTKHNEDKLYLASSLYDAELANTAQYLQDWTMHDLVLLAKYETYVDIPTRIYLPEIMVFYKHGFNGKRAILGDTVGIQLGINF